MPLNLVVPVVNADRFTVLEDITDCLDWWETGNGEGAFKVDTRLAKQASKANEVGMIQMLIRKDQNTTPVQHFS